MNKIVQRTAGQPLSPEALEDLKHLTEMKDSEIDTHDIPERRFGKSKNLADLRYSRLLTEYRKAS